MKLVIADDHPVVLEGLEALLRSAGHEILGQCTDGSQVLQALAENPPEVLVLDVQMPGPTGIDILRHIKAKGLPTRVVLLSSSITNTQALEAVRLGTDGLILKEAAARDLVECVKVVGAGGQWIGPAAARLALSAVADSPVIAPKAAASLTPREAEIVRAAARGRSNKEIARELQISEGTVKMHLHRIYEKLNVRNRTELSAVARDRGLI
jgi:two-component system, NarL family, nitrate/nitrite response regulator NarL